MDKSIFELNPFKQIIVEEFDPYIEFNYEFDNPYSEGVISNTISRVWESIIYILHLVGKVFRVIINGLRKLFSSKTKSGNECAEEVGLKKHEEVTEVNKYKYHFGKEAGENAVLNFIEKFDGENIYIDVAKLVARDPTNLAVPGKAINAGPTRAEFVIKLMINPKPINDYIAFFNRLYSLYDLNGPITENDIKKISDLCSKFSSKIDIKTYTMDSLIKYVNTQHLKLTIDDFIDFQKKVNQMCEAAEKFDNINQKINTTVSSNKKKYIDMLNELSWACVNLQGGLHAILNGLKGVYNIDSGYFETISSPSKLAEFVQVCIDNGMPAKYIANNIINVSTEKLKGKNPKPNMGFGRMTLIPEGDIVYKIALNEYGIRSNKNDFIVMDEVKHYRELSKYFVSTNEYYGNYVINEMDKVKAGSGNEPNFLAANKLGDNINKLMNKHNIPFKIVDIKPDAFGKQNGEYKLLDYGFIVRKRL